MTVLLLKELKYHIWM